MTQAEQQRAAKGFAEFWQGKGSLADLYDEVTMPVELRVPTKPTTKQ